METRLDFPNASELLLTLCHKTDATDPAQPRVTFYFAIIEQSLGNSDPRVIRAILN